MSSESAVQFQYNDEKVEQDLTDCYTEILDESGDKDIEVVSKFFDHIMYPDHSKYIQEILVNANGDRWEFEATMDKSISRLDPKKVKGLVESLIEEENLSKSFDELKRPYSTKDNAEAHYIKRINGFLRGLKKLEDYTEANLEREYEEGVTLLEGHNVFDVTGFDKVNLNSLNKALSQV